MRVEIFTAPNCDYCIAAKRLLEKHGVAYVEIDITKKERLVEYRELLPQVRCIPEVFMDGVHIGSYEELRTLVLKGQLGSSRQSPSSEM